MYSSRLWPWLGVILLIVIAAQSCSKSPTAPDAPAAGAYVPTHTPTQNPYLIPSPTSTPTTYFTPTVTATPRPTPTYAAYQNFETGNGTLNDIYFQDVWRATSTFAATPVHDNARALQITIPAPASGDNGGTVKIYPSSGGNPIDMTYTRNFLIWVYDTSGYAGGNTVKLALYDNLGQSQEAWSSMSTTLNQWSLIYWDLSQFASPLDKSKIMNVEIYLYNGGVYFLDTLGFQ